MRCHYGWFSLRDVLPTCRAAAGVATHGRQNNDVIVIRSAAIIAITLPRDVTVARLPRRLAALVKIMIVIVFVIMIMIVFIIMIMIIFIIMIMIVFIIMIMIVFIIMIMIIFMIIGAAERIMRISQQTVGPLVKLVKIIIGRHQNNNQVSSKNYWVRVTCSPTFCTASGVGPRTNMRPVTAPSAVRSTRRCTPCGTCR